MTASTAKSVAFFVSLPPVPIRRNSETRNAGYRSKLKRAWQEEIWIAGDQAMPRWSNRHDCGEIRINCDCAPWERAVVTYEWRSTHETDVDNIIASMKPCLDVLKATGPRPLGIVADDGPGIDVRAVWQKAHHKRDEGVLVTIERLHDD